MAVSRMASVAVVITTALVGASGWSVASLLLGNSAGEPASLHGARLGQTASQLRVAFQPPGGGRFRAAAGVTGAGDLTLAWEPMPGAPGASAPREVRFELHAGLVVAIRAIVPDASPAARGPALQVRDASVSSRSQKPDQTVSLSILARDCPTHAAEVRALLSARPH